MKIGLFYAQINNENKGKEFFSALYILVVLKLQTISNFQSFELCSTASKNVYLQILDTTFVCQNYFYLP